MNITAQKDYESEYKRRFERYTSRTNGKTIVGEALAEIIAADGHKRVADIGAGDGVLTDRFRASFDHLLVLSSKHKNIRKVLRDDSQHRPSVLGEEDHEGRVDYLVNGRRLLSWYPHLCPGDRVSPIWVPAELDHLTVIEAKEVLADKLGRFGFDELVHARAEDIDYSRLDFDCGYMSYAINGVPEASLPRFLRNFFDQPGRKPTMYIVTDGDYSAWGETAKRIAELLDVEWNGGSGRDLGRVAVAGGQVGMICDLETRIFAPSIEELTETLSAFFVRAHGEYDRLSDQIARIVEANSQDELIDGEMRVAMSVSEQVYELVA